MVQKESKFVEGQLVFWKYIDEFFLGQIKSVNKDDYSVMLKCKNYRNENEYYECFDVKEEELYPVEYKKVKYEGFKMRPKID